MACDSCGETDDILTTVTRLYVTADELGVTQEVTRASSDEQWCTVCLVHYPHELPDDTGS